MDPSLGWLWYIIIGILAGFIAGKIMRGGGFGVLMNLVVGIIGAMVGGFLFGILGLSSSGVWGSLITSTVGAIVLLWIISFFKRR